MTATKQLIDRMAAAQRGINESITVLGRLARKADKAHDRATEMQDGEAKDELLAGLQATAEYCRSAIEESTGEKPQSPEFHDARDHGGKFAKRGSYGHLRRLAQGKT